VGADPNDSERRHPADKPICRQDGGAPMAALLSSGSHAPETVKVFAFPDSGGVKLPYFTLNSAPSGVRRKLCRL